MSKVIVEFATPILEIAPHNNADRLEIASVKGWKTVVPKDTYKVGDIVTYIPVDAVIPIELSDKINVTRFLSNGRVRAAKLRGVVSYGFVIKTGTLTKEELSKITKYFPPPSDYGDMETPHPLFHEYLDIERIENFTDPFPDSSKNIVITEKIHGQNSRIGYIRNDDGTYTLMAGSHKQRRKMDKDKFSVVPLGVAPGIEDLFNMIVKRKKDVFSIVIFGEIYGANTQKGVNYDLNKFHYRAFDIAINGNYVPWRVFKFLTYNYGIPTIPVLFEGKTEDPTTLAKNLSIGSSTIAKHMKEGAIVRSCIVNTGEPNIYKVINPEFELDKRNSEFH